ncbi:MAG: hypothetical protein PHD81_03340 [Candidatus Nanoarchaeia archaeon]|nr:hypothetical protein [Candidatus Nanoarchaeia archaeon]MDD5588119.1 hypothetical protein [Candidatus Nanoarchaeia archaeon]
MEKIKMDTADIYYIFDIFFPNNMELEFGRYENDLQFLSIFSKKLDLPLEINEGNPALLIEASSLKEATEILTKKIRVYHYKDTGCLKYLPMGIACVTGL